MEMGNQTSLWGQAELFMCMSKIKFLFLLLCFEAMILGCQPSQEQSQTGITPGGTSTTAPSPSPGISPPPSPTIIPDGTLSIESFPSGAQVWVNNIQRGVTPILPSAPLTLTPGTYVIKLTRAGYLDISETVTFLTGQHVSFSKTLISKPDRTALKKLTLESAAGEASEFFAYSASAANLDGDAYSDIIVSTRIGKVYIFYGKDLQGRAGQTIKTTEAKKILTGASASVYDSQIGAWWQRGSELYTGHFFTDVKDDLVIALPSYSDYLGSVFIFKADDILNDSRREIPVAEAKYRIQGDSATKMDPYSPAFGTGVAFSDLNGDGKKELLISATRAEKPGGGTTQGSVGRVYIYQLSDFGSTFPIGTVANAGFSGRYLEGMYSASYLGDSLVNLGDANGDGIDDIAMRARVEGSLSGTTREIIGGLKGSSAFLASGSIPWKSSLFFDFDYQYYRAYPLGKADTGNNKADFGYYNFIYFGAQTLSQGQPNVTIQSSNRYGAVSASDYDGDGFQDLILKTLILPNPYPSLYVMWGQSSGFGNMISIPPVAEYKEISYPDSHTLCSKVLSADFNGNGIFDFIFVSPDKNYSTLSVPPVGSGRIYMYWFE